jgi:hypothetical protein
MGSALRSRSDAQTRAEQLELSFTVQVYPGGSVRFEAEGHDPDSGSCCGRAQKPMCLEEEDIIGATIHHKGSASMVHILYCPVKVARGKRIRHLKKAGPFIASTPDHATDLATEVRLTNNCHGELLIGGKTVLGVVNPKAGLSKYVLRMWKGGAADAFTIIGKCTKNLSTWIRVFVQGTRDLEPDEAAARGSRCLCRHNSDDASRPCNRSRCERQPLGIRVRHCCWWRRGCSRSYTGAVIGACPENPAHLSTHLDSRVASTALKQTLQLRILPASESACQME